MKIVRNINDYRTPFNLVLTRLPVYWEGAIAPKKKKKRSWRTAVFGVLSNRVNLSYTVRQYGQITVTVEKKKPFLFYEKKKPIEILRRHEETAPPARFLAIASKIYTKTNGGGDKGWSGGTGGGKTSDAAVHTLASIVDTNGADAATFELEIYSNVFVPKRPELFIRRSIFRLDVMTFFNVNCPSSFKRREKFDTPGRIKIRRIRLGAFGRRGRSGT